MCFCEWIWIFCNYRAQTPKLWFLKLNHSSWRNKKTDNEVFYVASIKQFFIPIWFWWKEHEKKVIYAHTSIKLSTTVSRSSQNYCDAIRLHTISLWLEDVWVSNHWAVSQYICIGYIFFNNVKAKGSQKMGKNRQWN